MKKDFTLAPRIRLDDRRDQAAERGRWDRRVGRIFLVAAVFAWGVQTILSAFFWGTMPPVTIGSMLDAAGIAHLPVPIALDAPLWVVLLMAAAIPYAIVVHQSVRYKDPPGHTR
jgi:hypothetical protein